MTRARHLRRNATRYERILWRHLRNRKFDNWKFRRQHPVERYILDFYCPEARLAIELDGGGHNDAGQQIEDQGRTDLLSTEDILLLRFWNHQIRENLDGVLQTILFKLDERARRNPSP
jgi:very-short-patch-repair endonuclease